MKKRKVLVIDDNPLNLKLIKTILEVKDFEVIAKSDPEEIMNNINSLEKPDLILLDIQMPVIDGVTLFKYLRKKFGDEVPITALTAYAMKGDKERFLGLGFDDYIEKPIDIKKFLKKVEGCIEKQSEDSNSG